MNKTAIISLQTIRLDLEKERQVPSIELAVSLVSAAQTALEHARALAEPLDRIGAIKQISDQLDAIENYFKKQGAELITANLIDEQRIRTLGTMGLEYDALPDRSGSRTDLTSLSSDNEVSPKQQAEKRTGLDRPKFSRCFLIGAHLDELEQWFPEVREKKEQSFSRAIRWLMSQLKDPEETPPLPEGKFRTILVDPPWNIQKIERDEAGGDSFSAGAYAAQGKSIGYGTMSDEELMMLPVGSLADEQDCHLYLWTIQSKLPFAYELLASENWNFKYTCTLVWRKPGGFTPFFPGWMYNAEFLIFAHMGGKPIDRPGLKLAFEATTSGHSIKPEESYKTIEVASREPRLEMFARRKRPGWTVWGAEVPSDKD